MGRTVWVATNAKGRTPFHTDEDCPNLQRAANSEPKDLDHLGDRQECRMCSDEWTPYRDKDQILECDYCRETYSTKTYLYRHILQEHRDVVEAALGNDWPTPTPSTPPRRAIADD